MRLGTYYRHLVIKKLRLPIDGKDILDIGGYDGFILSIARAENKTLIDMDVKKHHTGMIFIKDDFLIHDFGGQKFDRIFAFDVLEHVKDDNLFMARMLEDLTSDGFAILSVPSENIRVFPYILQTFIDKRWGHIYRRGYSRDDILKICLNQRRAIPSFINWNCPVFRLLYIPLSLSWKISPVITKKILGFVVNMDSRYPEGPNGFLFIVIKKA